MVFFSGFYSSIGAEKQVMKSNDKLDDAFRIASLLEKHIKKERLTASEQEEIEKWLATSEGNGVLFERITDENQLALALVELQDTDTESALAKVHARIDVDIRPRRLRWRWAAAAAVLVFVAIGIGLYRHTTNPQLPTALIDPQEDVLPGGSRAMLTLADGRTIDLSEAQTGIIVGEGITYLDGSSVLSEPVNEGTNEQGHGGTSAGESGSQAHKLTRSLQLTTPKGGTYQITLSDGTKVWLNSASTLKYPSQFDEGERIVYLEGEAYFDVSHQLSAVGYQPNDGAKPKAGSRLPTARPLPFRVVSAGQHVEVLGTQFNISAYTDERKVKTTLIEGSVRVISSAHDRSPITIKPNQQSTLQDGAIMVADVDVKPFTAWKAGHFHFNRTPFTEVMAQMSRWYDIELIYEGTPPSQTFTGKLSRNVSLLNVLQFFKGSGIKFRLADKKLFIEG